MAPAVGTLSAEGAYFRDHAFRGEQGETSGARHESRSLFGRSAAPAELSHRVRSQALQCGSRLASQGRRFGRSGALVRTERHRPEVRENTFTMVRQKGHIMQAK